MRHMQLYLPPMFFFQTSESANEAIVLTPSVQATLFANATALFCTPKHIRSRDAFVFWICHMQNSIKPVHSNAVSPMKTQQTSSNTRFHCRTLINTSEPSKPYQAKWIHSRLFCLLQSAPCSSPPSRPMIPAASAANSTTTPGSGIARLWAVRLVMNAFILRLARFPSSTTSVVLTLGSVRIVKVATVVLPGWLRACRSEGRLVALRASVVSPHRRIRRIESIACKALWLGLLSRTS